MLSNLQAGIILRHSRVSIVISGQQTTHLNDNDWTLGGWHALLSGQLLT